MSGGFVHLRMQSCTILWSRLQGQGCWKMQSSLAGYGLQESGFILSRKNTAVGAVYQRTSTSHIKYSRLAWRAAVIWKICCTIRFVANVNVNERELNVNVNRFDNPNTWNADNRHRVVIPLLHCFSRYFAGVFFPAPFSILEAFFQLSVISERVKRIVHRTGICFPTLVVERILRHRVLRSPLLAVSLSAEEAKYGAVKCTQEFEKVALGLCAERSSCYAWRSCLEIKPLRIRFFRLYKYRGLRRERESTSHTNL